MQDKPKNDTFTIREASEAVWKTELTIRRLVKSKKIPSWIHNWVYLMSKNDVLKFYDIKEETMGNKVENSMINDMTTLVNSTKEMAMQLWNMAQFYKWELDNTQRLLTASRKEVEEKENKNQELIRKKDSIIRWLVIIMITLLILYLISYAMIKQFIIINF